MHPLGAAGANDDGEKWSGEGEGHRPVGADRVTAVSLCFLLFLVIRSLIFAAMKTFILLQVKCCHLSLSLSLLCLSQTKNKQPSLL